MLVCRFAIRFVFATSGTRVGRALNGRWGSLHFLRRVPGAPVRHRMADDCTGRAIVW
jgi:hypothetical protein